MDREPIIGSSNIFSVGYFEFAQVLEVETKSGVYAYRGIPKIVHDNLMAAESVGKFFNANIVKVFQANILCDECRRWHPKGDCPPACWPEDPPECVLEHVHGRQCYDDPGPAHGSPTRICDGKRRCDCVWAAGHEGKHICHCGQAYPGESATTVLEKVTPSPYS